MMEQSMKEKSKGNDLQSKGREPSEEASRVMSFDVYFMKLVATKKAQKHHKAPMRSFAEQRGLTDATERQFDDIFRSY